MDTIKSLGQELKIARQLSKLSLREVEDVTGISNAYLSQLENDKVKKPSANILHKLSNLYGMNFEKLLEVAGIVQSNSENTDIKSLSSSALYSKNLTSEEENELINYLAYLRFRRKDDK